jgi:hypothetical protein
LSALGQVKTGMQLGHGRPDQPEHGFEVVAVEAGGAQRSESNANSSGGGVVAAGRLMR